MLKKILKSWPILLILSLNFIFFWKFFLKNLVPIPADVIVGIYHPWRDDVWNNLVAGVPFKNGLLSDVVSIIYPWRIYGMELLKNGIWPLWIPQALSGAPLLANFQSGIFYPLNILFLFFSNVNAWSLYIILQPILASLFCFTFLRNLKLTVFSSLIGSIIFAFSGFSIVWLEYGIVGHAGLWLPLILLTIDKISEKPSLKWLIVGALSLGFSFLAGYPQISFLVFLAAGFYFIYKLAFQKEIKNKKVFLYVFSFFVLGFFLSAIQLFPGFELLQLSIRSQDPTAIAFNFGLNPLKNFLLFLAPDFYGNPATGNFWGWGGYNESSSYVGIVGLLLAVIALCFKREKNLNFFKFILFFSLLMVFTNPFSRFVFNLQLPILASSSAGRFLFLTDFSLAVLAAFGAEFLMRKEKFKTLMLLTPVVIVFALIALLIFLKPDFWPDKNLLLNLNVVKHNLLLPAILMFISLVFLVVSQLKQFLIFKKLILALLFFLVVFDLFRFGLKYTPFSSKNYLYPQTQLTSFLQEKGELYRFASLIPQSMFIPYNLSSVEGYEPLMIKRYSEFAQRINEEKFNQISTGSRWITVSRNDSALLNLSGTKYLLSFNSDPVSNWDQQTFRYPKTGYDLVFQYGKSQVYENKKVLPRAFVVHDFKVLADSEILQTLMDKNFDSNKTLLFEENPRENPAPKKGEETVVIDKTSYFNNKVLIKTNTSSDGFLFLSDTFYPGWQAFVDGKETKIYRANYTFRAVFLPQGEHLVKFIYNPQSFKLGFLLSLISLASLFLLGIYRLIKK